MIIAVQMYGPAVTVYREVHRIALVPCWWYPEHAGFIMDV